MPHFSAVFQGQMVSHVSSSLLPRMFQSAKPFHCQVLARTVAKSSIHKPSDARLLLEDRDADIVEGSETSSSDFPGVQLSQEQFPERSQELCSPRSRTLRGHFYQDISPRIFLPGRFS